VAHLANAERRSAQELARGRLEPAAPSERWIPLFIVLVGLALWEWAARTGHIRALFFPPPTEIAKTFVELARSGRLWLNLRASLVRLFSGYALGAIPGLVLGLITGRSRRLRVILDPLIAAAHPVPKVSLLPLIMIIFGIGDASKVVTIAVVCFFPMLIGAMAAVREIPPIYFEVAENYGAGFRQVLTHIVAPATLPLVLSAIRLSLNTALLLTIAVELITAREGLGAMIWFAWETLRTEELYATLAVAAMLGVGFNAILEQLTQRLVPWQAEHRR
jgi:ABC-type nitrate/sulfonate/bicarbonate transport system permease component